MSSDRIMPTGRLTFPMSEFREQMNRALTQDGTFIAVVHGADFSMIEQYILATMFHESQGGAVPAGSLILDLDPAGGEITPLDATQRLIDVLRPVNRQMSLYAQGALAEKVARLEKPTKPNGRSLDYLRHDPTKRNRRRAK